VDVVRRRLVGAAAVMGLAGTAACSLVLGLSDHEPYPAEGGTPVEASAPDGTTEASHDAGGSDVTDAQSELAPEAGLVCETGSVCGDACVDLQTDESHCGTCGVACEASTCYRATCGGSAVAALTAGTGHACALLRAGDVWCWGADDQAQILGPADAASCPLGPCRPQPVVIAGLPNAAQISAGGDQTCAVDVDGGVWCWGSNATAGLGHPPAGDPTCATGDASVPCNPTPTRVAGLPGPATSVTSGQTGFACALASTGVYCWGDDSLAQLGPSGVDAASPAPLFVTSGASDVSAGFAHACALAGGAVTCWGTNAAGEMGHPSGTGDQTCAGGTPCDPSLHSINVNGTTRMHAGFHASCFESNGGASCVGANDLGQLGQGGDVPTSNPTPSPETLTTSLSSLDFSGETACAITATASLVCWGNDETHQTSAATPDSCTGGVACVLNGVTVPLGGVVEVRTSQYATFARTSDGGVWAWGHNGAGQLGHVPGMGGDTTGCDPAAFVGGTVCNATPTAVTGLP
jgi:alpha-tubulin suppressor-like RCC1 family protein